jgi:glycine cleavage system pyridoxal-binding protein P
MMVVLLLTQGRFSAGVHFNSNFRRWYNMDIGTGVAICGTAVATAAVLIKWIGKSENVRQCPSHSVIDEQIKTLKEWLAKVEMKLDKVIERM